MLRSMAKVPFVSRWLSSRLVTLVGPLGVTCAATTILLVMVDFREPTSIVRASLAVALLFAVFVRQAGMILDLDRQALRRRRQLTVMGDVVATLSESPNVGATLRLALERITDGLHADAAAVWLPSPHDDDRLILVEQIGLPSPDVGFGLLDVVRETMRSWNGGARPHRHRIPGQPEDLPPAHCLTVKLGRRAEDLGFLTVMKWDHAFEASDGGVLSTIGSDIAAAVRSLKMLTEVQKLADCDPLTNLYNHRFVFERLYQEVERHTAAERSLSVLMLDLDNFKLFNDTYGHPVGDALLKNVAGILREFFRDSDVVARYGGDEFMIILPETSLANAVACAKRLQHRFCDEYFALPDGTRVPIYVGCGVSNFPSDTVEVLELVAIADTNLYQAKASGRGSVAARSGELPACNIPEIDGLDLLRSLVIAVDNKDRYTRRHSDEVTEYALQIASAMGLDGEMLRSIHICGLVHDLGKIGVPDRILRKPGPLTPDEAVVMNQHPVIGALIVGTLPGMEVVVQGVRHHHERWNGSGYPDRLTETDIPLIARILAVADVFSAMTTHRPYRKALSRVEAIAQIRRASGTHFDPEVVESFLQVQGLQPESEPRTGTNASSYEVAM